MKFKQKPSQREQKRYIVFKLHTENSLPYFAVEQAIFAAIQDWLGEEGTARAHVWLIKNLWNAKKHIGFLKCSHTYVDDIKFALALLHQIGDDVVVVQTLKVAGTIASGKKVLSGLAKQ